MGAPRVLPALLAPAALALGLLACSSAPQPVSPAKPGRAPEAEPSPSSTSVAPAPAPAPTAEPAKTEPTPGPKPEQPASAAAGAGSSVVVIDPGTEEGRPRSLVEAAKAERERRAQAGEPTVVITNKSLAHSSGQLTHAQPKRTKAEAKGKAAAAAPHDEAYWRKRGLDIRVRWRRSTEDVERLQQEAADLRRRFYSQADPAVRDAQIKPEWDRTLELLDKARLDIVAATGELDAFMEEGRRAGALPGWLREGTDQEPEHKPAPPAPTDSIEPPILPPPPVLRDGPP